MKKLQHLFCDIKKDYKFAGVLFVVLICWIGIVGSSLFWNLRALPFAEDCAIIPLHFIVLILGLMIICGLAVFLYRRQSSLKEIAFYDYLTGLANRRLFNDRLNHEIIRAKRNRVMIGVLFLDLDGFKSVNDTIGHQAGDHLLQEVASRLKSAVRQGDTVARVGGDEFVLLISDLSDRDSVNLVVDKIVSVFDWPWIYKGVQYSIAASHGLSIFPGDGEDAVTLIGKADSAMYETKRMKKSGDNRSK